MHVLSELICSVVSAYVKSDISMAVETTPPVRVLVVAYVWVWTETQGECRLLVKSGDPSNEVGLHSLSRDRRKRIAHLVNNTRMLSEAQFILQKSRLLVFTSFDQTFHRRSTIAEINEALGLSHRQWICCGSMEICSLGCRHLSSRRRFTERRLSVCLCLSVCPSRHCCRLCRLQCKVHSDLLELVLGHQETIFNWCSQRIATERSVDTP